MVYETSQEWIEEKETASKKECLLICLRHSISLGELNEAIQFGEIDTVGEKIVRESFCQWLGY